MFNQLEIIKGIHPGFMLERELKKRNLRKGPFALSLQEFPQTLVSITKGKRRMNVSLALKIENALGLEEGFLMTLQVFYDIEQEKRKLNTRHPDLSKLRRVLFWDTKMENINWEKHKRFVIERVFERGNEREIEEITSFYGNEVIKTILKKDE
jgi:plasmid maintenance system antidote protein VapI